LTNHIDPESVSRLAERLENEVGGHLAEAKAILAGAESVSYSNFTAVHKSLAMAYVEAWNFHNRDLESKNQTAAEFRSRLDTTVDTWLKADEASDVLRTRGSDL
jgi:hypothetical protein